MKKKKHPRAKFGNQNPAWRGGKHVHKGYVLVRRPSHPKAQKGYVSEHVLVMERLIGRYLTDEEVVHHIDGNKRNNAPENLKLYASNAEHLRDAHHK